MRIELLVNGKLIQKEVSPDRRLLDFLRDDLGLKGTKKGCDQGECGACSVIIDKKIVYSCLVLLSQLSNKSEIITIESNSPIVEDLKEAFVKHGAIQCGACTPGMIMASTVLLMENPNLSEKDLRNGLSGVLCRCTGYTKIFDAIRGISLKAASIREKREF
jgi:carbon-monoxide dehydrogenase small subunit